MNLIIINTWHTVTFSFVLERIQSEIIMLSANLYSIYRPIRDTTVLKIRRWFPVFFAKLVLAVNWGNFGHWVW